MSSTLTLYYKVISGCPHQQIPYFILQFCTSITNSLGRRLSLSFQASCISIRQGPRERHPSNVPWESLVAQPQLTTAGTLGGTHNLLLARLELVDVPLGEDDFTSKEVRLGGRSPDEEVRGEGHCEVGSANWFNREKGNGELCTYCRCTRKEASSSWPAAPTWLCAESPDVHAADARGGSRPTAPAAA